MSELITGGINFGYQSPISQIYKDVEYKFKEDMENKTIEAVHHFGISVDKEELIKALQYDRNQYDKGYSDGRASIVKELENQKTGHWIPVSERLPNFNDIVLASTDSDYDELRVILTVYNAEEFWFNGKIKAWMPLPEPYKAESEE